jgi:hypothetical protein
MVSHVCVSGGGYGMGSGSQAVLWIVSLRIKASTIKVSNRGTKNNSITI